ncbi:MAG: M14 family metallopeptidase [Candidatus Cloacimonadaceae bacterium]
MSAVRFLLFGLLILALAVMGCSANSANIYPLPKAYLHHNQLHSRLTEISGLDPALAQLHVLGFSGTEELPILALQIGKAQAQRNILIIGQHHGDEVLGVELSVALAAELMRKHESDKLWKQIMDEYRFFIVPTINPEGWKRVCDGEYQFKRKNNRDTNKNGRLDIRADGVDLNRNYPVFWADQVPVPPGHANYKGERPASETEVQAILKLAEKHLFELAIFYHSSSTGAFSEKIFLPNRIIGNEEQERRLDELFIFAQGYAQRVKKDYQKGYYQVGEGNTSRVGNARNFFFHTYQTDAFLVELGGINSAGISVVHPNANMKDKIMKKNLAALRQVLYQRAKSK